MTETVGLSIERMQELIATPLSPPPSWITKWQVEAEHELHLAHLPNDAGNIAQLRLLDAEARWLVDDRERRLGKT